MSSNDESWPYSMDLSLPKLFSPHELIIIYHERAFAIFSGQIAPNAATSWWNIQLKLHDATMTSLDRLGCLISLLREEK